MKTRYSIRQLLAKIKWAYRKLSLPVSRDSLILEVGSGGNPHPYSSVLVERYFSDEHRLKEIEVDSRLVLADACKLPFRDNTFDYSLSYHVLEHVKNPSRFLDENMRVSKAGYIETPNYLYERFMPLDVHLSEIAEVGGVLRIKMKESAVPDEYIASVKMLEENPAWATLFSERPDLFHVQLYWESEIRYEIYGDEESTSWFVDPLDGLQGSSEEDLIRENFNIGKKFSIRGYLISLLKMLRENSVDIEQFLVCTECKGELNKETQFYTCRSCNIGFARFPVPDFTNPITKI